MKWKKLENFLFFLRIRRENFKELILAILNTDVLALKRNKFCLRLDLYYWSIVSMSWNRGRWKSICTETVVFRWRSVRIHFARNLFSIRCVIDFGSSSIFSTWRTSKNCTWKLMIQSVNWPKPLTRKCMTYGSYFTWQVKIRGFEFLVIPVFCNLCSKIENYSFFIIIIG